jgi:hypothetical protein
LFTGFGFTAFAQTQTITATGTFQTPDGITSLRVECWGGGGRGGSTVSSGNETGGGGGGAYARRNALTVTPRTNYNVQVGSGSTNTSPGGDTFFNNATTVMAKGGNSVPNNNTNGATGGTAAASIGDVTRNGGNGANGNDGSFGGGGGSSAGSNNDGVNATNRNGATAPTGGGNGGNGRNNSNGDGTAGSIPGGGGGVRSNNTGSFTGGAGARGQIIVTWTCSNVLTSAAGTDNQNACLGSPITNITYTCSGAYGATFAGLPTGVTGTYTDGAIVISGTPTATGTFTYTVTPTGSCTSSVVTGRIVVNPSPTAVSAVASSTSVCLGTAVNLIASATSNSSTAVTLLSQNFNGATNNWTTINNSSGGTPANAAWTLRPNGYDNTNDVFNSNDNSQFYLSDSDAQGSGSTTATILQSPSFSTVGLSAATLTFFHFNRHFSGQVAVVEASTDGSNWATLAGPYTSTQGAENNFAQVTANMSAYLNQPTVFIRFKFDSPWGWYWAVDNVTVAGTLATVLDATYAWTSNPPGFTSNLKNPTNVTPAVTTTYTVTATNNFGCTATASTTVVVNNPVPVSVSIAASATTICAGTSVTFTATPTNGGTSPAYQWRVNGNPVGTNSATFTSSSLTNNDVVTVVMTSNATPCLAGSPATSNSITMTVNPILNASVSIAASATTICAGTSVTFTATPTNGGTTPAYQWRVNGNPVGTNSATFASSSLTNNDVVTVIMTSNATPCLAGSPATSNSISMTVTPQPTATIAPVSAVCYGYDASFVINGTAGATVAYTLNGGATQTGVLTGGTLTVSVTGAQASQTLVLQTITLGGCVDVPLSESATITVATTTWNGSAWSNGAPDATTAAFVTGNLTVAANLQACRMFVSNNAVVTVNSGFNVSLFGALEVATGSTFTLNSNANLLQEDPTAVNVGNIVVRRTTNPLIRLDYILWGSAVASQNLFAFSPLTSVNPTIRFYGYNTTTNLYNNVSDYATHIMQTGRGYLIRLPFNHPTAPATWTGVFTGVPNNGTKTVTLNNVGPGQRFNLVSNPYPSTLDINTFFAENSSALESTLYFWRKTNNANSPTYCTWNMATETYVDNGEAFTENPNGVIQVGQGFFVEAKGNATSMAFNNTQRVANNANQMFRSTSIEKNRIWLNITRGVDFAQTVVGYFTDGSLDLDATDSKYFNDGNLGLMTQINGTNYIVNGRPVPFDAADVVPLTYKATTAGQHTIAIDRVDGLFTGGTQPIYIRDLSDGTYHNLNQGPFTFNTQPGTFSNRLELVYQNALSNENPTLEATGFEVVRNNTSITVQASQTLQKVTVFDLRGRIVMTMDAVNATTVTLPVNQPDQVFIVQVPLPMEK